MRNARANLFILAFDIGSSSTRTAVFDEKARCIRQTAASIPYGVRYTPDGGAELSPFLLRRAAKRCLGETLRKHGTSELCRMPVTTIAASSLWHALIGLDRHARPITPVFTWADSRASDDVARLREKLRETDIHARTGCMLRSSFWPAKILWLKRTRPKLFQRIATWASPVDWIFRDLFGTSGSSESMASATGLYNFTQRTWDEELCEACDLDPIKLPSISDESVSRLKWRIFNAIGDGAAGNLGSGADRAGIIAINVGTSAAARTVQINDQAAQKQVPFGLFRYAVDAKRSVVGGAVSNAGNLRGWCLREMQLKDNQVNRALSRAKAAADSLTVLPFWVSERAPTWPERQLGVLDGLNQSTRSTDILRATTTAVFYRLAQIVDLVETGTRRSRRIIVSGGIVHSMAGIRLLADAIGRDVEIAREREASLRGAAIHALNQLGIKVDSTGAGKLVKCNRALATKHRARREKQIDLEKVLSGTLNKGLDSGASVPSYG
jgi:gluconokinase